MLLGAAAAVIASQALITGSYTLVSEAILLDLLPHLEIRYPSDTKGQLYIGTVNSVLWIGCSLVVLYFRSGARMESAYGLAITVTMLMTTLLLGVYLLGPEEEGALLLVLLVFGGIESVFFISSLGKFMHGGYVTVILTLVEYIDRDVLYSILDKDTKRAQAYWFVNLNVLDDPRTMTYELETYGTDCIFRIRLNLGFKCSQRVNVYLRQIVQDLQQRGELPNQEKKYSMYGDSTVGTFKFCFIMKSVTTKTELSTLDEFILNAKYAIRKIAGSRVQWYGLDTSSLILETVPLITGGGSAAASSGNADPSQKKNPQEKDRFVSSLGGLSIMII